MNKHYLFFVLLCLSQISKFGFCLEEDALRTNKGFGRHGFISVTRFGAVGDGKTDDSQAFLKAWEAVCKGGNGGNAKLQVPRGKTFMLKPLTFFGPCMSSSITFLIKGNLVSPGHTWNAKRYPTWISFNSINGLIVTGGGTINGRGSLWWGNVQYRPSTMHFNNCNGLRISNIRYLNSPRNHVGLSCSENIMVTGIRIIAPYNSPNTDGIDISNCRGVNIRSSVIATGDDCIAINSGSSFINITGIFCGPGHGISVGSLGENGGYATVEEVRVKNCTLTNTQNGVRIKTYQNGAGYARKISFEDINMVASRNPIIIDQSYRNVVGNGGVSNITNSFEDNKNCHLSPGTRFGGGRGVKVSNVRYTRIKGSSATDQAITLNCDKDLGCVDIVMDHVNMVSARPCHKLFAACKNVRGSYYASKLSCIGKYSP